MKRFGIALAFLLVCGVAFATSDRSMEPVINDIYDRINASYNTTRTTLEATRPDSSSVTAASQDTDGVVFSTLVNADTSRKYFYIQNKSTTDAILVYLGTAAAINASGIRNSADACIYLATVDNARYGFKADWTMPTNAIYTGEISVRSSTRYHGKVVYITY